MNKNIIEESVRMVLSQLEPRYDREGLKETPKRVAKAMEKVFEGYNQKPEDIMTVFENESEGGVDQIVGLSNIEFYSFCEHHMLPFFGKCSVYYIPGKKICGISKLARIVNIFARRLQNQERLTKQIADTIERLLQPKGVAVVMEGKHFCMLCRGVEKQNSIMKTSDLRGAFMENEKTRAEFFNLIK